MAALHGQQNTFFIPSSVEQEMLKHMYTSLPQEACGVVLGEAAAGGIRISRFQPIRNVAPNPLHHFSLDDAAWIRCVFHEPQLIGIFHSHPRTEPVPSIEDLIALPAYAGLLQVYLIGSPNLTVRPDQQMRLNGYQIQSNLDYPSKAEQQKLYHLQPAQLCVT
ncbi:MULTISPECIES: Mov34/MPN/PAD-1 family protein [Paenibacillus]|uniref:M67 family metallopeptidase n=1 Tax=Paenibacillus xylanilyticus TaxID=248903 RepID=A0A7Y6C4V7_9BACL|nr:M67 family metallopeptidase [Paenibacillus xylanilyticus]NUU80251.1 M67 family metallopeptidase [Paenibacillus xylanilyticus]